MKNKRDCSFLPFQFAIKGDLLYNIMKCNLEEYAMNVVGEIGNFIMIYQRPIQGAAIAILLIGGMVCIGKAFVHAGKKRKLMEQINQTVSEINANVKFLSDKKTGVPYIDGRMTPENNTPEPAEDSQPVKKVQPEQEVSESPEEEKVKPAVKYFSRDCAVAKDGRQYTLEELHAQIRD